MLKIILRIFILYCFVTGCLAVDNIAIYQLKSLLELKSIEDGSKVTAHYSILANSKFTPNLHSFTYKNFTLKLLNKDNPDKIILQVIKNLQISPPSYINTNKHIKFPWWSKSVPKVLKQLDFSKVDGKENVYKISNEYQLTLLEHQGCWGKVYVLERLSNGVAIDKICAVKILLTRSDRGRKSVEDFRVRHKQEIDANLQLVDLNMDFAIKPYGILQQDLDHYLLFLEYGDNAQTRFKTQDLNLSIEQINDFIREVDIMHSKGYSHGDLKIDNVLIVDNKLKLCDWFSLYDFNATNVGQYRYYGDNLPPEAIRANYFKKDKQLKYARIVEHDANKIYILHPVAADRFCWVISLLEIMAPDLYEGFGKLTENFNPYSPDSLDFWQVQADYLQFMQKELLQRAHDIKDLKQRKLFETIVRYINLDPLSREYDT
jgi:serine/threonine protein kinase